MQPPDTFRLQGSSSKCTCIQSSCSYMYVVKISCTKLFVLFERHKEIAEALANYLKIYPFYLYMYVFYHRVKMLRARSCVGRLLASSKSLSQQTQRLASSQRIIAIRREDNRYNFVMYIWWAK